ncbi:MAG: hypothetical protein OHK93_004283 [Ramalina farinacea]|uniref:Uncharacterized protein n=1 Tax=Ramalina farinacea TaxID=258253 RepID=A0AA43TRY7_9LECA|nr:hypothetical protein [Ramalina farinacea]
MSKNSTLPQAFPSPQPNSTTTEVIVNIAFGIAGTAISAFTIYHGHRMWKLWRLNGNGIHDGARARKHLNGCQWKLRQRPSSSPWQPRANRILTVLVPTGENINDVEQDVRENDGAQT